jgi:hypothetical protein
VGGVGGVGRSKGNQKCKTHPSAHKEHFRKKSMSMSKIFYKKTGGGRKKILESGVVLGVMFVK